MAYWWAAAKPEAAVVGERSADGRAEHSVTAVLASQRSR